MKIGIMGGTFNPIHNGHIEMMQKAMQEMGLDDILLIPTGNPPHKPEEVILPKYDRYELCLLSAVSYDNILVSSIEIERSGFTYTIDTLRELERLYGSKNKFYFIIGGDTVFQLESWKEYKEVFKRCEFIAFGRENLDSQELLNKIEDMRNEYKVRIKYIDSGISGVSSSEIRERLIKGQSIEGMVPDSVGEYLLRHGLYK